MGIGGGGGYLGIIVLLFVKLYRPIILKRRDVLTFGLRRAVLFEFLRVILYHRTRAQRIRSTFEINYLTTHYHVSKL